jgi:hypothetical protein
MVEKGRTGQRNAGGHLRQVDMLPLAGSIAMV